MLPNFTDMMPILASDSLDATLNKMKFVEILGFIVFIVIPVIKLLFGKKGE